MVALAAYMFESRFSTSTSESFAIGSAGVLLDGAVRRHVLVGHTSYQNALSDKRVGDKERGHVYALYSIMFACVLLYTVLLFCIPYSTLLYSTLHFRIGPALLP